MRRNFWIFLILFANLYASADEVDRFIAAYTKKKLIPGVALLVVKNGVVVRSQGYGFSNLEHRVPVKPQTVFQSGSMGKQFTATGIAILAEEGKLQFQDPVSKYLQVPESWKGITIRHLLTHTSGLGDYPEDLSLQKDYTEEDLLKMITTQSLTFQPGEKWNYSNLGYVTLGILIHKISGKFYGDFLQERIFRPLEMKNTRIISEADIIPNRAAGYRLVNSEIKNQEWVSPSLNTTADGSLYFTIEDLTKWDTALRSGSVLKKNTMEEMWTPVVLNNGEQQTYGFGWVILKTRSGRKVVEHSGEWQGFTTHIARYMDDQITVVVLCNLAGSDSAYIAHKVAGLYNRELAPVEHQVIEMDLQKLESFAGKYRLDDRLTVEIKAERNKLTMQFLGQNIEMFPENDQEFFEKDSERSFEFQLDRDGNVTGMVLRLPMELKFRRIPN